MKTRAVIASAAKKPLAIAECNIDKPRACCGGARLFSGGPGHAGTAVQSVTGF
ncbi:MAG: hypothetical protein H7268_17150 [Sandarakinorhabdus sp.]|nr:hypothetical protein [Sandarakinorhabdus sp.]